jgi:predicted SnoaL-like aldol condensation-catalyzing enzyme
MRVLDIKTLAGAIALLAMTCLPVAAQSKSMTPQEQKNLKLALDWWREGFIAGHAEVVDKYLSADMIQHNPNMENGNARVKELLKNRTPVNPIPAAIPADRMPAMAFAKGDYVVLIWEREGKDPADPSKMYKFNDFDLFRVQNGKFVEHWDGAMKNPPRGAAKE